MAFPHNPPAVAQARPPAISNRLLAQLRRIGHDAPHGLASTAEAEWLLSAVGPLLDELEQRRVWMDGHGAGADWSNIIPLPAVRA